MEREGGVVTAASHRDRGNRLQASHGHQGDGLGVSTDADGTVCSEPWGPRGRRVGEPQDANGTACE